MQLDDAKTELENLQAGKAMSLRSVSSMRFCAVLETTSGAPCPADGIPCEACRGFVDEPNLRSLEKVLMERAGFSQKRAVGKARMFTANLRG